MIINKIKNKIIVILAFFLLLNLDKFSNLVLSFANPNTSKLSYPYLHFLLHNIFFYLITTFGMSSSHYVYEIN